MDWYAKADIDERVYFLVYKEFTSSPELRSGTVKKIVLTRNSKAERRVDYIIDTGTASYILTSERIYLTEMEARKALDSKCTKHCTSVSTSKYKPGDIVWYISGKQYWNPEYSFTHKAAKAVVLEAKGLDYKLLSVPSDCELLKGEENLYATKEEVEKVLAGRIAVLSHKQPRAPRVREKLDALIKKLEEEKKAWIF